MTKLIFACCFCGEGIDDDDDERAQIVLLFPAPEDASSEPSEQYWWAHRKPCFEAALNPQARIFADDEEVDWEQAEVVDPYEEDD